MVEQSETKNASVATGTLSQGLGLTGAGSAAAPERVVKQALESKHGWWWGVGRRKTAVARVRIRPGSGDFRIQLSQKKSKKVDEYFTEERDRQDVAAPLKVTGVEGKFDVVARLRGGGTMGQAGALALGLSRALKGYDPNFEGALRDNGLLTRDDREVERKKYGQAGARRRFQFSKR